MGVYMLSRSALDLFSVGEHADIPDLVTGLVADGRDVRASLTHCRWLDIGRPEDYSKAIEIFDDLRYEFLPEEDAASAGEETE
jgi:NDP-sugar pyrophosphorylase family protein